MYGTYGGLPPIKDYATFVGLWLNAPHVRFRTAPLTLAGVAAASNNDPLDRLWFEALARFPEEVDDLMDAVNRERGVRNMMTQARGAGS